MIAHVVLFTPRTDLDTAAQEALVASLERACSDIPEIKRVRVGRRRSVDFQRGRRLRRPVLGDRSWPDPGRNHGRRGGR